MYEIFQAPRYYARIKKEKEVKARDTVYYLIPFYSYHTWIISEGGASEVWHNNHWRTMAPF